MHMYFPVGMVVDGFVSLVAMGLCIYHWPFPEETGKTTEEKKHINRIFTGLSRDSLGIFIYEMMCFVYPIKQISKKNT